MCTRVYALLLFFMYIAKISTEDLFLVRPGDGEQFVYSPVDVNATLHCAVNNTPSSWDVDGLTFDIDDRRDVLTTRGIFQSTNTRGAIIQSTLTVYGDIDMNNNTKICCEYLERFVFRESCTTLVIYGSPSPPENVSVQYTEVFGQVNISWTATPVMGVDQNYTVFFDSQAISISEHHYIYSQNIADSKISCSVYVTAVNGAGESDPSNNVTIPSLPDIGPVTASLSHQVWKSAGGEIMVNISFKPALYCVKYPVSTYLLKLRSEEIGSEVEKSLGSNETEVTIGSSDGLRENRKYQYTVTSRNSVGNTTSNESVIITSDVQSVTATVVGESTIDIQCLFIHGSDAVGCKVVLVSDHPGVNNETAILIRKNTSASAKLKLTHQVGCYYRVFAYSINVDNSTSNFKIIIDKMLNFGTNSVCTATEISPSSLVAIVVSLTILTILIVMVIVVIAVLVIVMTRKKRNVKFNSKHKNNNIFDVTTNSTNKTTEFIQNEVLPTHHDITSSHSSPSHTSSESPNTFLSTLEHSSAKDVSSNSVIAHALVNMALYAVPEKVKIKGKLMEIIDTEKEEPGNGHNEENFYHILENDHVSASISEDAVAPSPAVPHALESASNGQLEESTAPNDVVCCNAVKVQTVPLYAVPDKVRSKNKFDSVLDQSVCVSMAQDESGDHDQNTVQEHIYHVLENTKAPCKGKLTPLDSIAPDLPPPFKPDTPPSGPPPVYQDITEINTKT